MNAARAIRQLEQAGFSHDQAASLVSILEDEVLDEVATKQFVELTAERIKHELKSDIGALRVEFRDRHIGLIKWLAGIAIVQTASIIFGTVGLMRLLG